MSTKNVFIEINLRERDASRPRRVAMADKVAERMAESLHRLFVPYLKQQELKISILTCSEGSTAGRMWAAEFGMGWAKLDVEWHININEDDDGSTPIRHLEHRSRSGYCGCIDMFNSNYGEEVVTGDLCDEISMAIASKANPQPSKKN